MGLKKYIVVSVLLALAIGGYVFTLEPGDYRIVIMDKGIVLPVVVWVMAPYLLLFLGSLLHMIFYGMKSYFRAKAVKKDQISILAYIKSVLLGKNEVKVFKTKEFQDLAEILAQFELKLKNKSFTSSDKDLNDVANQILQLQDGKYVSTKELKLADENELVKQNIKNRVLEDEVFCLDVVKKSTNYSQELVKVAFFEVLKNKSMTTIKKALPSLTLDKEMLIALIDRDVKESDFRLSNEELTKYLKSVEFTKDEYLDIAKKYKTILLPDQLIAIFETISTTKDIAMDAYIYILFEFEMIDKVRDILSNASENDYLAFRALLDLKDLGKQYTLEAISYK